MDTVKEFDHIPVLGEGAYKCSLDLMKDTLVVSDTNNNKYGYVKQDLETNRVYKLELEFPEESKENFEEYMKKMGYDAEKLQKKWEEFDDHMNVSEKDEWLLDALPWYAMEPIENGKKWGVMYHY